MLCPITTTYKLQCTVLASGLTQSPNCIIQSIKPKSWQSKHDYSLKELDIYKPHASHVQEQHYGNETVDRIHKGAIPVHKKIFTWRQRNQL